MSVSKPLYIYRLRWLWHVVGMSDDHLPREPCLPNPGGSWKRPSGGQHMTWKWNVTSLAGLAGWGPRDPSHPWLETLSDMASFRSQWRSCSLSLALSYKHLDCLFTIELPSPISDVTLVIGFYVAYMATRTIVSHLVHGCETGLNWITWPPPCRFHPISCSGNENFLGILNFSIRRT